LEPVPGNSGNDEMGRGEYAVTRRMTLKEGKNQKADCCSRLLANGGERCPNHVFSLAAQKKQLSSRSVLPVERREIHESTTYIN